MNTLGAVTHDGERFVALTLDQFTDDVAKHFLRAVQQELGEKLVVVLDNARYVTAKTVTRQAAALVRRVVSANKPTGQPLRAVITDRDC